MEIKMTSTGGKPDWARISESSSASLIPRGILVAACSTSSLSGRRLYIKENKERGEEEGESELNKSSFPLPRVQVEEGITFVPLSLLGTYSILDFAC